MKRLQSPISGAMSATIAVVREHRDPGLKKDNRIARRKVLEGHTLRHLCKRLPIQVLWIRGFG
jgi:hypothetical protein